MKKHILYIVAVAGILSIFSASSTFADNVDYSVNVAPSLKLTIPDSSLILNLNPPSKTFDSKDLTVTVGTNNATGYNLTLSTPNDNTDLERDTSSDTTAISATIPTLDTGTYTESTFTANKWGYSINSNTAIPSTITSGFIPFTSGNTLMERDTAVNQDQTNLTFASKIDYLQPAGAYSTTLLFSIIANRPCNTTITGTMQDFYPCPNMAIGTSGTLTDARDNKTYTVAKLADGQIWMTSNLNLAGGTTLNASDSDVPTDNYFTLPTSSTTGFDDDTKAYVYNTGNETADQADCYNDHPCNSYYSWLAATAGGKDASGTAVTGNGPDAAYSICPKGWRLPKSGNRDDTSATSTTGYKKGDFYKLATAYGANLESSYYQDSAVFYDNAGPGTLPNFLLAGRYYSSTFLYGGADGRYWSSSSSNTSTSAYSLYFISSSVSSAHGYPRGYYGFSVRCIAK